MWLILRGSHLPKVDDVALIAVDLIGVLHDVRVPTKEEASCTLIHRLQLKVLDTPSLNLEF